MREAQINKHKGLHKNSLFKRLIMHRAHSRMIEVNRKKREWAFKVPPVRFVPMVL